MKLLILLALLLTLDACQNPGRFQGPQIGATHGFRQQRLKHRALTQRRPWIRLLSPAALRVAPPTEVGLDLRLAFGGMTFASNRLSSFLGQASLERP